MLLAASPQDIMGHAVKQSPELTSGGKISYRLFERLLGTGLGYLESHSLFFRR